MTFARMAIFALILPAGLLAAEDAVPGYEGEVQAVVDRALLQYRSAKTYQDHLVIRLEVDAEGDPSLAPSEETTEVTLAWARPQRIALAGPSYTVVCDGKTLWQRAVQLNQYIEAPAPQDLDLTKVELASAELGMFSGFDQYKHPIAVILGREGAAAGDLFDALARFTGVQPEALAGQAGKRVSGVVEYGADSPSPIVIPFDAWFSDQTGLLGEIRYDFTKRAQEILSGPGGPGDKLKLKKYVRRFQFDKISLDGKVADKLFVFTPDRLDRKVARFEGPRTVEDWQRYLVGQPAADFVAKDFDGKTIKLSDLKGRVVLLDFWATRCRPCLFAMPSTQKLADAYADKPVSVIGVNLDGVGSEKTVREVLEKLKVTYRQVTDVGGKISTAYRVTTIPCLALIGKDGTLQAIQAGFAPGEEKQLGQQIDQLLKGQDLFAPPTPPSPSSKPEP